MSWYVYRIKVHHEIPGADWERAPGTHEGVCAVGWGPLVVETSGRPDYARTQRSYYRPGLVGVARPLAQLEVMIGRGCIEVCSRRNGGARLTFVQVGQEHPKAAFPCTPTYSSWLHAHRQATYSRQPPSRIITAWREPLIIRFRGASPASK